MKSCRFTRSVSICLAGLFFNYSVNAAMRPEMPVTFDAATVQKLIDGIEKPPSAMILRSGYFMRRGAHPLATEEGFVLLQKAAEKEPGDGKRWFVLQSTLAFAAFRVPGGRPDEGFAAYTAVFEHAAKAGPADALYTLRQAINDYLFLVQGRFGDLKLQSDERTGKTLGNAWAAYASVLGQEAKAKPKYVAPEPMWTQAIAAANLPEDFDAEVEKTIADPAVPKTFALYKAAVSVFEGSKPQRAVEVLQQARPLLPKDDLNEAAWYFGKLVASLERQATHDEKGLDKPLDKTKLAEAIAVQEDMVKTTGRGHTRRAELRRQGGDEKAFAELVAQLSAADAPEPEILAAGELLSKTHREAANTEQPDEKKSDENSAQLLRDLLNSYLKAERQRSVASELRARLMLGRMLLRLKQPEAARAALATGHLTISSRDGLARSEMSSIQRLLGTIDRQSAGKSASP